MAAEPVPGGVPGARRRQSAPAPPPPLLWERALQARLRAVELCDLTRTLSDARDRVVRLLR